MHPNRRAQLAVRLLAVAFVAWALAFIWRNSFVLYDGRRYFNLFDDAFVSMRYGWNLAHGRGLVWNAGELVEGYTNLLMTLFMAAVTALWDKATAVLVVQLSGIGCMLVIAEMTRRSARDGLGWGAGAWWLQPLAFACGLAYYPLAYWSLMGMETGLLAALLLTGVWLALRAAADGRRLPALGLVLGLAFLTRPDSLLPAGLLFAYVAVERAQAGTWRAAARRLAPAAALYALFPLGQALFRWSYYGSLVPNTYVLKISGIPLAARLANGVGFILPFMEQTVVVLALAALNGVLGWNRPKTLFLTLFATLAAYQVWVGGDFYNYWRFLAPAMPLLLLPAADEALALARAAGGGHDGRAAYLRRSPVWRAWPRLASVAPVPPAAVGRRLALVGLLLFAGAVGLAQRRFWPELSLARKTPHAVFNATNASFALALNDLTDADATLGVFWAGTIPYYADRYAIDYLGKADPVIARRPPDLSGAVSLFGMTSWVGHNKYDLDYSLKQRRPTYTQYHTWWEADESAWVAEHYTQIEYRRVRLYLLTGSPHVRWETPGITIVPWDAE